MTTTHVCMKTNYVKSRTGEIRPIVIKAYIVPSLRSELISVKSLNRQGYRVVHDPDPEESGIYPIFNLKIDKLKSFAFRSEQSIFYYIKAEAMSRVVRNGKGGWPILRIEKFIYS